MRRQRSRIADKKGWKNQQNTVYRCNLKVVQKKGLHFYQTRSNAIVFYNTVPAICIEKVRDIKSGENYTTRCINLQSYREEPYSSRMCIMDVRISPISKREHPSTIKAKKARSTGKSVAKSSRRLEAVTSTSEYKSTTLNRSKRRRCSQSRSRLMADLNKNQKIHLFSEKSKELIRSMGNTEYFEMCEITCKIQCPDCSQYWEIGIEHCTCGKCLQPSERNRQLNKERCDGLSIPNYVIKKNPSHGARHGPTKRQRICYKSPQYVQNLHTKKVHNTILERLQNDPHYRHSLTNIGWAENTFVAHDEIAKEDHSYVATRGETLVEHTQITAKDMSNGNQLGKKTLRGLLLKYVLGAVDRWSGRDLMVADNEHV